MHFLQPKFVVICYELQQSDNKIRVSTLHHSIQI